MITKTVVGIIEFGSGNILSVKNAFERLGCEIIIIETSFQLKQIDCLVIPGVGSFQNAITNLKNRRLIENIINFSKEKYVLGICLGMQIFSTLGLEGGSSNGLNLVPGTTARFNVDLPLPHVGWNTVRSHEHTPLFKNIDNDSDFYFTHSYIVETDNLKHVFGWTNYGLNFPSVIINDKVIGVQFHPEKSGQKGKLLLSNFIEYYVKNKTYNDFTDRR